jgi:hypothetical protein
MKDELKLSIYALATALVRRANGRTGKILEFPKAAVPKDSGVHDGCENNPCTVDGARARLAVGEYRAENYDDIHHGHKPMRSIPVFGHVAVASQ